MISGTIVLSKLEFDVLWEHEKLPPKHEALTVPSPGRTHTERRQLVAQAFSDLEQRGLAKRDRAVPELADWLTLLAHHQLSIDSWVWTDRQISALTAAVATLNSGQTVAQQDLDEIKALVTQINEAGTAAS